MATRRSAVLVGGMVAGLLLAGGLEGQERVVERSVDAEGVEVVTVRGGVEAWGPVGSVAPQPDLDIISMDPDDPWSFFGAVSAVRAFEDGGFVVADGQSGELHFFDADGEVVGSAGGRGEAPGRFRSISAIPLVAGDTLWVWDAPSARVSAFTREGWMASATNLIATMRLTSAWVLPDRGFLGVARDRALVGMLGAGVQEAQRDTVRFQQISPTGSPGDVVLELPGEEWLRIQYAADDNFVMNITAQLPLGRDAHYVVLPDGIVGGPNDRFEIQRWDHDGTLQRRSRFPELDEVLTGERVEALRQLWLEGAEGIDDRVEVVDATFAPGLAPEVRPAFRRLLVDMGGRVWIQENDPWNPDRPRWWLFDDAEGVLVGYIDFPAEFEVHEIGPDFVLGVHRDFTELPHVRRYALEMQLP